MKYESDMLFDALHTVAVRIADGEEVSESDREVYEGYCASIPYPLIIRHERSPLPRYYCSNCGSFVVALSSTLKQFANSKGGPKHWCPSCGQTLDLLAEPLEEEEPE